MTQPAKVQEPSMEEILASIRRIIADDEAKPAGDKAPAAAAPSAKPVMKDIPPSAIPAAAAKPAPPPPPPPPASFRKVDPQDDLEFSEAVAAKAVRRPPAYEPPVLETSAPPQAPMLSR